MSQTRVRFAPSPTGFLHIGGVRTALYNWLFARHTGGKFILRIEDTDRQRSEERFTNQILDAMRFLGLSWDEGPFFQSARLNLYREHAEQLLREDKAYEVEEEDRRAVKFRLKGFSTEFKDLVYGKIRFDEDSAPDDLVIIKSDGMPTYHFSCVVDDALMEITHVIRGDDHVSNTPKQIALYEALGFNVPEFAHIPMILGEDKARLSKRHGATSIDEFACQGFSPEGLLNYLALLGWSPGGDREIMSLDEMVELFSLERVIRKSSVFSMDKLAWMNGNWMEKLELDELLPRLEEFAQTEKIDFKSRDYLARVAGLMRSRTKTYADFFSLGAYFFKDELEIAEDMQAELDKFLSKIDMERPLEALAHRLEGLEEFSAQSIESEIRGFIEEKGFKVKPVMQAVRLSVSGVKVTPDLFATLEIIGCERIVARMLRV